MKNEEKDASIATRAAATRKQKHEDPRKKAVLIVDDEPMVRLVASEILNRLAGLRTYQAKSNKEAMQKLQRFKIDVVVSDLNRPGGTGFDLLAQMAKSYPRIPVIISSGSDTPSNPERAQRLGAFAYFPKPYRGKELAAVVLEALRQSAAPAASDKANP